MHTTGVPRVRVLIVNYRSIDNVRQRLDSEALQGQEVVVVDNASEPDAVVELCRQHGAQALLLAANLGFAAGVNAGWEACRNSAPLPLLLLNPDAELTRNDLDRLMAALASSGSTGVGPVLMEASGRLQIGPAGGPLSVRSVAGYFLMGSHLLPRWQGLFLTRRQSQGAGRVHWLCMASLLLSPHALERFGPLPEDEVVYAEDIAWGTRATERGAVFRLVPDIVVRHPHGSSGGSSAWTGALERLLLRRLGLRRGRVAVTMMRAGLAVRRVSGRQVGA